MGDETHEVHEFDPGIAVTGLHGEPLGEPINVGTQGERVCEFFYRAATSGRFDAVFSGSEDHYKPYFDRAYPWADFEIIDPGRTHYPISATMVRMMEENEELRWLA